MEEVDNDLKLLINENKALTVENLTKIYPNGKKAVDNLNL